MLHVTGCPRYREDQCTLWAAGSCGEGLLYPWFESDGVSHLGGSGAVLRHRHVHVQFDSSLAQNGFWCSPACPQGDGRDCVLGARGQAGSWGTTLLSCTLSPKEKGKRGPTPAERVVKGKPVLERRGRGGGAVPEPPSKRARVEHWPWPMHHGSNAKHVSEGQNAEGET